MALDRPPYVLILKVIRCVWTITMGFPTQLLKTAISFNSPVCSSFSYCELNTANWILSDNQENDAIVVFFFFFASDKRMSCHVYYFSTFNYSSGWTATFQLYRCSEYTTLPNHYKSSFGKTMLTSYWILKCFQSTWHRKIILEDSLKLQGWRKQLELIGCTASSEHILSQPAFTCMQWLTPVTQCKQQ